MRLFFAVLFVLLHYRHCDGFFNSILQSQRRRSLTRGTCTKLYDQGPTVAVQAEKEKGSALTEKEDGPTVAAQEKQPVSGTNLFVEGVPASFDTSSWEQTRDFLYHFGLEYESQYGLLNGIYAERRHYPLKIAIRMDAIQTHSLGDPGQLSIETRKFVELCVGILTPKQGWGKDEKMAGIRIKGLRRKYADSPRYLKFLDTLDLLNGMSKLGLHEHVNIDEAELTPLKRAQLKDGVYQAARYVMNSVQKISKWAPDTERAYRLMEERNRLREREEREERKERKERQRQNWLVKEALDKGLVVGPGESMGVDLGEASDPVGIVLESECVSESGVSTPLQQTVADRRRAAQEEAAAWTTAERERLEVELEISSRSYGERLMGEAEEWGREQAKLLIEEKEKEERESMRQVGLLIDVSELQMGGSEQEESVRGVESQASSRESTREREKEKERGKQKKLAKRSNKRKVVKKQRVLEKEEVAVSLRGDLKVAAGSVLQMLERVKEEERAKEGGGGRLWELEEDEQPEAESKRVYIYRKVQVLREQNKEQRARLPASYTATSFEQRWGVDKIDLFCNYLMAQLEPGATRRTVRTTERILDVYKGPESPEVEEIVARATAMLEAGAWEAVDEGGGGWWDEEGEEEAPWLEMDEFMTDVLRVSSDKATLLNAQIAQGMQNVSEAVFEAFLVYAPQVDSRFSVSSLFTFAWELFQRGGWGWENIHRSWVATFAKQLEQKGAPKGTADTFLEVYWKAAADNAGTSSKLKGKVSEEEEGLLAFIVWTQYVREGLMQSMLEDVRQGLEGSD
ncbi:hypothetical protein B484DRAFT_451041 [Ochromonadaceae sp. CCMP2298]|nr:hypothetical protein B484DRAFT_451041 [Ochromonadaceae sp. CCMP2298]